MELFEAIHGRRSVRRFKADPVARPVLERLLDAAQWAPSWAHTQCCDVVLVSRPEVKTALQATLPATNSAFKAMVDAPWVAAFCGRTGKAGYYGGQQVTTRGDWLMFDVALAMENFMLAAHAEGLGTVCVGMFDAAAAAKALGLPEGVEVVALSPLGYPDKEARVPPRRPPDEFAHWEQF